MFTLRQLQQEQAEWVKFNFPNRHQLMPLMGIIEELGELAHAQLKGEQGIRYTPEVVMAKKVDAIGDILVYTSDYCSALGLDLEECIMNYGFEPTREGIDRYFVPPWTPAKALTMIARRVGEISQAYHPEMTGTDRASAHAIGGMTMMLSAYCRLSNIDMLSAVETTWSRVKQRNWIANPIDANKKVEGDI